MIRITLPDNSVREFPGPVTGAAVAASIGAGLAKAALAIKINGEVKDLTTTLTTDVKLEIITLKSPDAAELIRHDCSHIMAQAVQELFPGTQVTFGPATETGFYYDFHRKEPFSTEDLAGIEARMREIVKRDLPFIREVWSRDQAVAAFMRLAKTEGIIPALESAHALAAAIERVPCMHPDQVVIVNLSGRGDKDVAQVAARVALETHRSG